MTRATRMMWSHRSRNANVSVYTNSVLMGTCVRYRLNMMLPRIEDTPPATSSMEKSNGVNFSVFRNQYTNIVEYPGVMLMMKMNSAGINTVFVFNLLCRGLQQFCP